MGKRYDQKCVKCGECAFFREKGKRPDSRVDPDDIWPEACGRYGYIFHDEYPPAPECEGFMTPVQLAAAAAARARRGR